MGGRGHFKSCLPRPRILLVPAQEPRAENSQERKSVTIVCLCPCLPGCAPSPSPCCRQVRDFLQRVRSRRFPSIELDMKMVLAHCGSLLLDPAAVQEVRPQALPLLGREFSLMSYW